MPQKLTLRKAARLRKLIEARVSELRSQAQKLSTTVNIFDPKPLDELDTVAQNFQKNYAKMAFLMDVLYELRKDIGAANQNGINDLLAERSKIQAKLAFLHQVVRYEPRLDNDTINARLAGMREKNSNAVAYNDNVSFDVLPSAIMTALKADQKVLRLHDVNISDKIEQLNNTLVITLSDESVTLLTSEGIL